jgi:hypothetical protein
MPIYNLTMEKKDKLLKEQGQIESDYKALQKKTPEELWEDDLAMLEKKLDEVEKQAKSAGKKSAATTKTKSKGKGVSVEPSAQGEHVTPTVTKGKFTLSFIFYKKTILKKIYNYQCF